MEFSAKRSQLKVTIEGVESLIRSPSISQLEELDLRSKDKSNSEISLIYKQWLSELGLPMSSLNELDKDSFLELIKFISSPKKN